MHRPPAWPVTGVALIDILIQLPICMQQYATIAFIVIATFLFPGNSPWQQCTPAVFGSYHNGGWLRESNMQPGAYFSIKSKDCLPTYKEGSWMVFRENNATKDLFKIKTVCHGAKWAQGLIQHKSLLSRNEIPIIKMKRLIRRFHLYNENCDTYKTASSQIAKFMGPTWVPPGSCQPQMGPMLAPWTLLSGFT